MKCSFQQTRGLLWFFMILEKLRSGGKFLSAQNRPPEGFALVVQNVNFLGTFSLTKSSPIGKRIFSCRFSLQKALE